MIRNYIKIAWRNVWKNKLHTFINVMGLTIAFSCCLLIVLYVRGELSFDKFNRDHDRTYRVVKDFVNDDGSALPDATTPPALIPAIIREIPEVEQGVRLFPSWGDKFLVKRNELMFYEERVYRADTNVFDVFTFDFIAGKSVSPLRDVAAVVITESMARKYFGKEWESNRNSLLGQSIEIGEGKEKLKEITAVIRDIPYNAHFHFDFLLPMYQGNDEWWGRYNWYSYVKIRKDASISDVEKKVIQLFKKHNPESKIRYYVQAIDDIHLTSKLKWELEPNGDRKFVQIFMLIGIFVMLIAAVNYINLSILQSFSRAKEVGIRKVAGAHRSGLIRQFITESITLCLIAYFLAFGLVDVLLPFVNTLVGKHLHLLVPDHYFTLAVFFAGIVVIGIISGFYPALFISRLKPVNILKGADTGSENVWLRKGLILLQFVVSVALIAGTVIVIQQVNYLRLKDLGFEKDQVLVIPNIQSIVNKQTVKNELAKVPHVIKAGSSNGILGGQNWTTGINLKGSSQSLLVNFTGVDHEYLDVMKLKIKEGRNFSRDFPSDTVDAVIINETAVRDLGISGDPLAALLTDNENASKPHYWKVIGVVKDFHFVNLRSEIKPYMFILSLRNLSNYVLKIEPADVSATLEGIRTAWSTIEPGRPFEYFFLDDRFAAIYQEEENFKTVFSALTLIAIYIACAGLFAVASYAIQRRTKEIGIRKVLGASVRQVTWMLTREFVVIVILANLVALPAAYLFMKDWLNDFAYRINPSAVSFVSAGVVALVLASLIVVWKSARAASSNPAHVLRNE